MNRQIEQALYSLMPAYGSDLPSQLLELAESLLSQSRLRASTLKQEEEVARLYACAHIACDRLKIPLDLPPIQPRPPAPPRIYKQLYNHLDNILPKASASGRSRSAKQRTPRSKAREDAGSDARPLPSRGTPTKEQSLAQFRTPSKSKGAKPVPSATTINASHAGSGLHPWIKPVIRFMCLEVNQPRLGPTLIAAMEHITVPDGRRAVDEWVGRHLTSLLGAMFQTVQSRFRALTVFSAEDTEPSRLLDNREIIALLNKARRDITVKELDEEEAWAGWTSLTVRDFESAVAKVSKSDWLESDWYRGIDDAVRAGDVEMLDGEDLDLDAPVQARRVDTMFQERYDYLSETRRAHYKTWKQGMLSRISQLRESQNAMEVDT